MLLEVDVLRLQRTIFTLKLLLLVFQDSLLVGHITFKSSMPASKFRGVVKITFSAMARLIDFQLHGEKPKLKGVESRLKLSKSPTTSQQTGRMSY